MTRRRPRSSCRRNWPPRRNLRSRDVTRELRRLRERWELARAGHGGLLTVSGTRGAGKSRLAAELAGEAHAGGASVLYIAGSGDADTDSGMLAAARTATHPTLVVVDDADRSGDRVFDSSPACDPTSTMRRCWCSRPARTPRRSPGWARAPRSSSVRWTARRSEPSPRATAAARPRLRGSPSSCSSPAAALPAASTSSPANGLGARRRDASAMSPSVRPWGRSELRALVLQLTGDVVELQLEARAKGGAPVTAAVICPYKGLAAFDVCDAPYFFGRQRLVGAARRPDRRLVAAGRSSDRRAAASPRRYGRACCPRSPAASCPAASTGRNVSSGRGSIRCARSKRGGVRLACDGRFVLAVDQFEEIFTACERRARARGVRRASSSAWPRTREHGVVVIALRADSDGCCAAYPKLFGSARCQPCACRAACGATSCAGRSRARPRRAGLHVEPALADALVADVEHEACALLRCCRRRCWSFWL